MALTLQHKKIFLEWIQNADSETTYAYSKLFNTLINTDIKLHREFVRQIDWTSLQESVMRENKPNLYSWGDLYNRLAYSLSKKEYLLIGEIYLFDFKFLAYICGMSLLGGYRATDNEKKSAQLVVSAIPGDYCKMSAERLAYNTSDHASYCSL